MRYKQLGVSIGLMYQQCSSMDVHKLLLASKMWVTHKSQSHTDYLGMRLCSKNNYKELKAEFCNFTKLFLSVCFNCAW